MLTISNSEARRVILNAQLLGYDHAPLAGKAGIVQTVDQLGYVQIDTISVIKRAHHHILWTRHADYSDQALHDLQTTDRAIFEYWGHAMSYLPMSDYRYFLPRMRNFENPQTKWARHQGEQGGHLLEPVLERIRNEGPLSSKDFAAPPDKKNGAWWDWKPAKIALELLFWRGNLMVAERRKFQKVYNLAERILPADLDLSFPEPDEVARFLVRRALKALGIANEKEIQRFMQPDVGRDADLRVVDRIVITKAIKDLVDDGEIIPVIIEQEAEGINYAYQNVIDKISSMNHEPSLVFLLSPFDNLIIQRDRLIRIFNFNYTLECYVPAAKRMFGYFVLPILYGDTLVGRLDPKADRENKTLIINSMVLEPDYQSNEDFLVSFAATLLQLARFNDCKKIEFRQVTPGNFKQKISSLLKSFKKS